VVAVRVAVVVRECHTVVEAERRLDAGLLESQVARVEILEGVVLERRVVEPGSRVLVGVVDEVRERGQRDAVIGLVVGDPGPELVLEQDFRSEQRGVPVDHGLELVGLEVHVVELGTDKGPVIGHGR
jgi:hypothetical protein